MIPLGPGGDRKLKPILTWILIGLNVVVFLATIPRRTTDDARLEEAAFDLSAIETDIRSQSGSGMLAFESLLGLRKETTADADFWRRFEAGRIIPVESPTWKRWDKARADLETARRAHLHWQWGYRRNAASPVTLVTSAFLHGDIWHLVFNMLFLWVVGVNMEEEWGRRAFLILYAMGIVSSACAVFFESPAARDVPSIGASGAIAAVMGAFAVACHHRSLRIWLMPSPIIIAMPAWIFMGIWFAGQLSAVGQHGANAGGVGVGVHALGFFLGACMALGLKFLGGEEEIAAPQAAQRRQADKVVAMKKADECFARGDARGGIEALGHATLADPDDAAVRERKMKAHAVLGEREAARGEGLELLERLWGSGDRARFAVAFAKVDEIAQGAIPVGLVHRAAVALEPTSPIDSARLYVRVAREGAKDPILPQSLRRYAQLLDRVGEAEKAAQVRQLLEQVKTKGS